MRYSDRDRIAYKCFTLEETRIYPSRVKGKDIPQWLELTLPMTLKRTIRIVPSQKADRRNGYWLDIACENGKFKCATAYMVRNFLPVGTWPIMRNGNTEAQVAENIWEEFKTLTIPEFEANFIDCKKSELEDRRHFKGVNEWLDLLERYEDAGAAICRLIDKADDKEASELNRLLEALCNVVDGMERKRYGGIEFEDLYDIPEYHRPTFK